MPVDRSKLMEAFSDPDPENQYFVDTRTGGVLKLSLKDPAGLQRFKTQLGAEPKRFVQVQKPAARDRIAELEAFMATLTDPHLKAELQRALAAPSPFREVNQAFERRFPQKRAWDEFRKKRNEQRVAAFLKSSGLQ